MKEQAIQQNGLSASDIIIPDYFFNRMKCGNDVIDSLFGGDELPGLVKGHTFTISGGKGLGKSTALVQMLQMFNNSGYNSCLISSEQAIFSLAYNAKRVGCETVPLANFTYLEDALDWVKQNKFEFVVLDSLQGFRSRTATRKAEVHMNNLICKFAQENSIFIGTVLHRTKTGQVKGDSSIEHLVDINIEMGLPPKGLYPDEVRLWVTTKNRVGNTKKFALSHHRNGFDFNNPIEFIEVEKKGKESGGTDPRVERKNNLKEKVLDLFGYGDIVALSDVTELEEMNGDFMKATRYLKELEISGEIVKNGRGPRAYWTKVNKEEKTEE